MCVNSDKETRTMDHAYDLVVRGGHLVDGSGAPGREADVGIKDGRIVAVGKVNGAGREEIDARGKLVSPGFVDVHTHYDGQATWDERMQPSSWHGVTSVVMGNCGVGFAPCKPQDHDRLVRLMEGVEDIPFPVLSQGLPWNWESFPDYLDALSRRRFDIDIGAQLPHAAVRVHVMGERGANREAATPEDIAAMAAIARRAAEVGAMGFSTSRTLNHRTSDGQPTPTLTAGEDELMGVAMALRAAGRGTLQFVSDFNDPEEEFAMLRRLVEASGRPLAFTLVQSPRGPRSYKVLLAALADAVAAGLPMKAQVAARPVGVLFGLELTMTPFSFHPTYREMAKLPHAEKLARLRDPVVRARLLSENPNDNARGMVQAFDHMHLMAAEPDYEPTEETTVAFQARARGVSNEEVALDHMLSNGGKGMLYVPFLNYADGSLDAAYEMLTDPNTVPGLSDGGAHVGMICDGSFPTSPLTHSTRDRTRGPKPPLEDVIRMQCRDTAESVGLFDRGRIAVGLRADLNVIDYDNLRLRAPEVAYDLPAGGRRLIQRADGYVATIVAGQVT
jgi:N-acyl-D-aspartate/D-glutamate deacylase